MLLKPSVLTSLYPLCAWDNNKYQIKYFRLRRLNQIFDLILVVGPFFVCGKRLRIGKEQYAHKGYRVRIGKKAQSKRLQAARAALVPSPKIKYLIQPALFSALVFYAEKGSIKYLILGEGTRAALAA